MASKFGYVERNLENDVNWANVGKGFSDMLLAERDERKAKKESLDDAMRETQDGLRKNAPLGYNTDFNDRMIGLAANSNAFVLAANKDLKAGRITPEEYMRKLQRINSSADTTFALANNYNAIYEDKLKRMDDKTSGNVEQAAFEAMSKLVDFNKHDFMIDENGTIVAAPLITDENGITSLDTKNARSVQAIFNLAQNTVNRFDVEGTIAESVERLGRRVLGTSVAASRKKEGMDVLIEGIKLEDPDAYAEWKKQTTKKIMADKFDVASILTDFSDEYETTTDKKKWLANKDKYVYVDIENGKEILIGELTDEQNAKAIDILDGVIESQVGSSRTEKTTPKVEASWSEKQFWWNRGQDRKKDNESLNQLALLYAGQTPEDIQGAIQYFKGLSNGKIHDIIRTDDDVTIVYKDSTGKLKRTSPLSYTDNFSTFAKTATALTGISDATKALKSLDLSGNIDLGGWNGSPLLTTFEGKDINLPDVITESTQPKIDFQKAYGNFLDENITVDKSGTDIQNKLKGMGIEAEFDAATNKIKIVEKTDKETGATSGPIFVVGSVVSIEALDSYLRGDATQQARFKMKLGTIGRGAGDDVFK